MNAARTVEDPPAGGRPPSGPDLAGPPRQDPEGTGRYQSNKMARPPRRFARSFRAYWTTLKVIFSYLWIRFRARFNNDEWLQRKLSAAHIRNARRLERTICELQGLFIKVGQLISIMTNFLPEQFRRELEGLQDAVPPRPYADMAARIREELGAAPERERELASLSVRSPARGTVVECLKPADVGRYVARGEALATVAGSTLVVQALFTEEELADAKPLAGQRVEFRSLTDPTRTWPGTIERIAPRGQRSIDPKLIEHLNPVRFAYDPVTQETSRSLFEVEVTLDESLELGSRVHGATGELLLTGAYEPIAMRVLRGVLLFASRMQI